MTKGNGKNGANGHNGKRDPFGPARRQHEYRQREKLKQIRAEAVNQNGIDPHKFDAMCVHFGQPIGWNNDTTIETMRVIVDGVPCDIKYTFRPGPVWRLR